MPVDLKPVSYVEAVAASAPSPARAHGNAPDVPLRSPPKSDALPPVVEGNFIAAGKVVDPWDEVAGPGGALDLDKTESPSSAFEAMLGAAPPAGAAWPDAPHTPPPPPPEDECLALMRGARELFDLGDFSGSLDLVEKVLKINPEHEGAHAYMKRNEATLIKMYESKLGTLQRTPKQLMPPDEVIWMNMHHKAGFILSQVDGSLTFEEILEISGMGRFDTMRILHELVAQGIIG